MKNSPWQQKNTLTYSYLSRLKVVRLDTMIELANPFNYEV